jgi:small subunit ribosomal protein S6e
MAVKVVMADPKERRTLQKEVEDSKFLQGLKIGDKFRGEHFELAGYEFEITGGSDDAGFPMRKDISTPRARILAVSGTGLREKKAGRRERKTVSGNMISAHTAQVNAKVIKYGTKPLFEPKAAEAPAEEKKQ